MKSNHVVPSKKDGGWIVIKSGSERAVGRFSRKEDAVRYGRKLSRREKTELYIHKKDGSVQNRNSYNNKAFPSIDHVN